MESDTSLYGSMRRMLTVSVTEPTRRLSSLLFLVSDQSSLITKRGGGLGRQNELQEEVFR
jgi:hypothetical protein